MRARKSAADYIGIAALLGALVCGGCSFAPTNVEVSVDMPAKLNSNDTFVIDTTIRNSGNGEQKLLSIDVPDKFIPGIQIERTEPPFNGIRHNDGLNSASYKFDMKLQPGDKQSIKIHARAMQEGNYSGDISFVVNQDWSALGYPIKMEVLPNEAAQTH